MYNVCMYSICIYTCRFRSKFVVIKIIVFYVFNSDCVLPIFVSSSCIDTPCWHHRASVYAVTKASVLPTVLHSYGQRPAKCVWPCPSSGVHWPARAGAGQKSATGISQRRLVMSGVYIITRVHWSNWENCITTPVWISLLYMFVLSCQYQWMHTFFVI